MAPLWSHFFLLFALFLLFHCSVFPAVEVGAGLHADTRHVICCTLLCLCVVMGGCGLHEF